MDCPVRKLAVRFDDGLCSAQSKWLEHLRRTWEESVPATSPPYAPRAVPAATSYCPPPFRAGSPPTTTRPSREGGFQENPRLVAYCLLVRAKSTPGLSSRCISVGSGLPIFSWQYSKGTIKTPETPTSDPPRATLPNQWPSRMSPGQREKSSKLRQNEPYSLGCDHAPHLQSDYYPIRDVVRGMLVDL